MLGLCFGVLALKAIPSEYYFVIEPCGPEVIRAVCIRTAWWIFEFRSNTISNHLLREIASMWIVVLSTSDAQSPSHSSCHIDTKRVQSKMAVLFTVWCLRISCMELLQSLQCHLGIAILYGTWRLCFANAKLRYCSSHCCLVQAFSAVNKIIPT